MEFLEKIAFGIFGIVFWHFWRFFAFQIFQFCQMFQNLQRFWNVTFFYFWFLLGAFFPLFYYSYKKNKQGNGETRFSKKQGTRREFQKFQICQNLQICQTFGKSRKKAATLWLRPFSAIISFKKVGFYRRAVRHRHRLRPALLPRCHRFSGIHIDLPCGPGKPCISSGAIPRCAARRFFLQSC